MNTPFFTTSSLTIENIMKLPVISLSIVAYTAVAAAVICYAAL
ncbi:MAG: hypothetical protein V4448_04690 [Pseudomonadota bacterium]